MGTGVRDGRRRRQQRVVGGRKGGIRGIIERIGERHGRPMWMRGVFGTGGGKVGDAAVVAKRVGRVV